MKLFLRRAQLLALVLFLLNTNIFASATSCIDPQLHFSVREFRGTVLDIEGNGLPRVEGELFRFHKAKTESGTTFDPDASVFARFVTDERGHFALPKLGSGMYRVMLHPPRTYRALPVVVLVKSSGVAQPLIAELGLTGDCRGSWYLAPDQESVKGR